jgi:hypothetical protein
LFDALTLTSTEAAIRHPLSNSAMGIN